jgi:predicted acylesterase/phospholipase RssA
MSGDTQLDALRAVPWLGALPDDALAGLAAASTTESLPAGAVLYAEGDPSVDLAVVVRGRLRAHRGTTGSSGAGGPAVDREVGAGEPVGELGALTAEARAATVVAVRDSEVVRVPVVALDAVLAAAPGVARTLTQVVADRLRQPVLRPPGARTVALISLGRDTDLAAVSRRLTEALVRVGSPAVLPPPGEVADSAHLGDRIAAVERDEGVVVLPVDGREPWWDLTCGRLADLVLLVGRGGSTPSVDPATAALLKRLVSDGVASRRELLLVHPARATQPRHTPGWFDAVAVTRHHHVREDDDAHADRIARHVLGRSNGLVLSGGGARAMAHLGAWRALQEAGIPIDHVGGSSIGGVLAVQLAMEPDIHAVTALDEHEFRKANFGDPRRITLPMVSLLSVRTAVPLFETLFGDCDLSDTWLPSYVTTVDFSDCELRVHDRGPAALWTRATASPPGLWPAVMDAHGHLHVDGGVLDNLPVRAMRHRGAGTVLAVNVAARRALAVDPRQGEVRSWPRWLQRRAGREPYPGMTSMLLRLGQVTSLPAQADALADADLVASPDLEQYGMGAYRVFQPMVDAGYHTMQQALHTWTGSTASR